MPQIEPRLLKGFQDFLPDVMIERRRIILAVCRVFERFGFSPLETPALEYSDILLGKLGEDAEKLLYRFRDNGDRDVCMRYDLTVPLARVVAMNRSLPMPFKRYQVGNVWRAESPGRGRFREFLQCDVDIVGTSSLLADAECLAVDAAVMQELGVSATIRFNNRRVFQGLQEKLGIESVSTMNAVLRAVDKLPKIGAEGVTAELRDGCKLPDKAIQSTLSFCAISGSNQEILSQLEGLLGKTDAAARGIVELRSVLDAAVALGVPESMLKIDPSVARGLDYYTGTVFETFLNDLPGFGSVMSGGRYDDLIGLYAGQSIPAVGISVGVDRLLAGLIEMGRIQPQRSVTDVLLCTFAAEQAGFALGVAAQLRSAGVATEVYLDAGAKLKKQMKYADSLGVPVVGIIGPDEANGNAVTVREMATGAQTLTAVDELVGSLSKRFNQSSGVANPRTWNWSWDRESIEGLPARRGIYILRDRSKRALEAGYARDPGLKAGLLPLLGSRSKLGVVSFDWYEVADEEFGRELASFLVERLVGRDDG